MKEETTTIGTPYDDVFRTVTTDSSRMTAYLVREMFDLDIDPDAAMETWQNEVFVADNPKRITDSHFSFVGDPTIYHLECESIAGDAGILLRLFEYDSAIALKHAVIRDNTLYVEYPRTGILFLRAGRDTPREMQMRISMPDTHEYVTSRVKIMRISDYTTRDIFEKNLLALVPFVAFMYEKDIRNPNESVGKVFLDELWTVKKKIDSLYASGRLGARDRSMLEELTCKVTTAVARRNKRILEGVEEIMGGQVLEYEAKTIWNDGWSKGEGQGRDELADSIRRLRAGETADDLRRAGIGEKTVSVAMELK